jgi:hypothetical protein
LDTPPPTILKKGLLITDGIDGNVDVMPADLRITRRASQTPSGNEGSSEPSSKTDERSNPSTATTGNGNGNNTHRIEIIFPGFPTAGAATAGQPPPPEHLFLRRPDNLAITTLKTLFQTMDQESNEQALSFSPGGPIPHSRKFSRYLSLFRKLDMYTAENVCDVKEDLMAAGTGEKTPAEAMIEMIARGSDNILDDVPSYVEMARILTRCNGARV